MIWRLSSLLYAVFSKTNLFLRLNYLTYRIVPHYFVKNNCCVLTHFINLFSYFVQYNKNPFNLSKTYNLKLSKHKLSNVYIKKKPLTLTTLKNTIKPFSYKWTSRAFHLTRQLHITPHALKPPQEPTHRICKHKRKQQPQIRPFWLISTIIPGPASQLGRPLKIYMRRGARAPRLAYKSFATNLRFESHTVQILISPLLKALIKI